MYSPMDGRQECHFVAALTALGFINFLDFANHLGENTVFIFVNVNVKGSLIPNSVFP